MFTNESRMEFNLDKWIRVASAVMQLLYWSVVVEKEFGSKAELACSWPVKCLESQ